MWRRCFVFFSAGDGRRHIHCSCYCRDHVTNDDLFWRRKSKNLLTDIFSGLRAAAGDETLGPVVFPNVHINMEQCTELLLVHIFLYSTLMRPCVSPPLTTPTSFHLRSERPFDPAADASSRHYSTPQYSTAASHWSAGKKVSVK